MDVAAGAIVAYRLFDVAYAIDLRMAEESWARNVRTGSSRGRLTATPPKAVAFGVPPVAIGLGSITLPLADTEIQASVTARLFEFGVVSIALHVAVNDLPWGEFSHHASMLSWMPSSASPARLWTRLLDQVRQGVGEGADTAHARNPGGGSSDWRRQQLQRADHRGGADGTPGPRSPAVGRASPAIGECDPGPAAAPVFLLHRRHGRPDVGPEPSTMSEPRGDADP